MKSTLPRFLRRRRRCLALTAMLSSLLATPTVATVAFAGTGVHVGMLAATAAPEATNAASELVQPQLQNSISIEYPSDLLAEAEPPGGEVLIKFAVGTDGVPKEITVERSVHPRIDALASEAVAQLRYQPGTYQGKPVEVVLRIALEIRPPAPAPAPRVPANDDRANDTTATSAEETAPESGGPGPTDADTRDPDDDNEPIRLSGEVLRAGDRTPIEGALVLAVPAPDDVPLGRIKKKIYEDESTPAWSMQTATDAEGNFALRGLPLGRVRVVVLTEGYERLDFIEMVVENEAIAVRYYQTPLNVNPYRTVVKSNREEREEVARRSISVEEINSLPGTQGDALKAIQNFPGLARSPFGIGLLLIRGAAPQDSAVYLGHHEIPQLFHFGGLTSVFNSDILTQIDFIPGNFDSRYGDAIGGVVNVSPRKGRRDGYHGYIDSDLFDTGVLFEGPIGKGSFILSGRRSYIDLLLPVVIPDDAGLDLTLAPRYYDYQALFDYPVSGGDFSVRVFGSDDRTKLVTSDANEVDEDDRNRFESTTLFHRADLVYRKNLGPWTFLATPSYRYDYLSYSIGGFFRFNLGVHTLSTRAEMSRQLTRRFAVRIGAETTNSFFEYTAESPPAASSGGSVNERFTTSETGFIGVPAVYTTWTIGLGDRFTLYPGVRLSYYTRPFQHLVVDPRLRAAWQIADKTTLKGGVGIYSQSPQVVQWDATYGNPRVGPERSLHVSAGVAQAFAHALSLEVTGFYKTLWNLAATSTDVVRRPDGTIGAENTASTGDGRIYGGELLARKDLTGNVYGWISYTLMRSERRAAPDQPHYLYDFDQTHILTLIGVVKLPKHWQIGARFRLVSGNPTTPVIGSVFDAASGGYEPIQGPINSDRLPMFHQLDLRVDKRWIWRKLSLNAYLDILNVYNHQNTEFYNYSYDYAQRSSIASLPILPSVGLKLEY